MNDVLVSMNSTEDKTRIYALYKQATLGDVQGSQPWVFELEVSLYTALLKNHLQTNTNIWLKQARAKWDGWNSLKGMSQEEAKKKYIEFATSKLSS